MQFNTDKWLMWLFKFLSEESKMITSNDLCDIYFSFLLIRDDIEGVGNSKVLNKIMEVIMNEHYEDNSVRKAISSIDSLSQSSKWSFAFYNNLYTYRELIKNKKTQCALANVCYLLAKKIDEKRFDQAYEFVDYIHFLPLLMLQKTNSALVFLKKISKKYKRMWGDFTFSTSHYLL